MDVFLNPKAFELPLHNAGRDLSAFPHGLDALVERVDGEVGVSRDGKNVVDCFGAHLAVNVCKG